MNQNNINIFNKIIINKTKMKMIKNRVKVNKINKK